MHCPNCGSRLKKVVVKSHYGVKIELNQCPCCGGVWCDDLEMHRVSSKSALWLGKLDAKKLQELVEIKKKLICPKCGNLLKEFKDPFFPKQIKLEHCSQCGGFWLNRGELSQFKKWQLRKPEISKKDKELNAQMDKILALHKDKTIQTWGKVGKFLSQPANAKMSVRDENNSSKIISYMHIVFQLLYQLARIMR